MLESDDIEHDATQKPQAMSGIRTHHLTRSWRDQSLGSALLPTLKRQIFVDALHRDAVLYRADQ